MLLDEILPAHHFRERHSVEVRASPERAWEAVRALGPLDSPVFLLLMGLRALPGRLAGGRPTRLDPRRSLVDQATGFSVLAEEPGREIVVGAVGQMWRARGGVRPGSMSRDAFLAFDAPGYVKTALNFLVEPTPGGSSVRTETRVLATDRRARRRFRLYWIMIRLGSGAIRRGWLRAIRRRAEA